MTASDASSPHDTSSSQPDSSRSEADAKSDASARSTGPETQESAGAPGDGERARYERFRRDFDHLSFEDQATFLVEAGLKTMARGIETAGRALADELGSILRRTDSSNQKSPGASHPDAGDGPGPAEPETSQRQTPKE